MAEVPEPGTPVSVELNQMLLDAKFSIPQTRQGSVSRTELVEAARESRCRVVGVTAPAGYGKSTLLTQWAEVEDRRVAWVSLDRFDDDPAILLTLLASAFARVSPGQADLVTDTRGLGMSVLGRAAPRLAAALTATPDPFVLMLDDLHELHNPACHDVLSVVISGIRRGSQLVAASRYEQPHIPRLRAAGDAWEFVVSDLALDADGAEKIFLETKVNLTSELAAAVTERTEGWPVGLYLAAMIARDSGEVLAVSGEDRYVADYLYRESMMMLPESVQHFLRCTAVLDQMCGALCDAVLGQQGAQAQLRELEASNLFLLSLDRRREWYRYHALFREFLLGELRRTEPEAVMKLHLRAADWYEAEGSPEMALEHLLNTTERDRCVPLLTQLVLPTYQAGQMSTVQRWLSTLGDSTVEHYPPLAVLACWVSVLSGQPTEALRWGAIVDAASFDLASPDGSASFDSARAMLRACSCPAGLPQMLADATLAVEQEPEWSVWRDTALVAYAEARLLSGDAEQATVLFAETTRVAASRGNVDNLVISEAELAVLAMDRGRWDEADERLEVALTVSAEHRMDDYPTSVLAFGAAARLAQHRGDDTATKWQLTRAMRARPSCTYTLPFLAVRARLQLAKVYQAREDHATAHHLMREIDDILLHRPDLGTLVDEVSLFREILTASARAGQVGGAPLTPAELRLLPYLQTHLTMREIGERLFVSRNTVSSEVGSIYRKLGVSSRNDAVQQATAIGLVGG